MLAYAPVHRRSGSPRALVLVIAGHAALIALVLTAKSELPGGLPFVETDVTFIETPKPPTPPELTPQPADTRSTIDRPTIIVPIPPVPGDTLEDGPVPDKASPVPGPEIMPKPLPVPEPPITIIRKAARFITPASDVRPPYPASKQRLEEEASLRLALAVDASGRVTSVTPVGAADSVFLDAARKHILRRWRYAPATEDGSAVSSKITVTLQFRLNDL